MEPQMRIITVMFCWLRCVTDFGINMGQITGRGKRTYVEKNLNKTQSITNPKWTSPGVDSMPLQ
jgi:hypothetical protein